MRPFTFLVFALALQPLAHAVVVWQRSVAEDGVTLSVHLAMERPQGLVRVRQLHGDDAIELEIRCSPDGPPPDAGSDMLRGLWVLAQPVVSLEAAVPRAEADAHWPWSAAKHAANHAPFWPAPLGLGLEASDLAGGDRIVVLGRERSPCGGNRVELRLDEPGRYVLRVPADADLELDLASVHAHVHYASLRRTQLTVEAARVNVCGDNGSSGGGSEHWDYYSFGSEGDPRTLIKTRGSVVVPVVRRGSAHDETHERVWLRFRDDL